MDLKLTNSIFSLLVDPAVGSFSITTSDPALPDLLKARIKLLYHYKGTKVVSLAEGWQVEGQKLERIQLPEHGETEILTLDLAADECGLACRLLLGIVQEHPLVLWKVEMTHLGTNPVELDAIHLLDIDPQQGGRLAWPTAQSQKELGFYSNGWQSWSPSRWYAADDRMQVSRLGGLQLPMIKNPGTPLPKAKGSFSSDFFAVLGDRVARSGFVIGSLSQLNHFTSISADFNGQTALSMWANGDKARLDPGACMSTDWAVFSPILLDHREPLEQYLEAVARENHIRVPAESPTGWCSWYHFYTKISEPIIRENLQSIVAGQETLPLQLVQVDDGFESQIGDWFTFKPEFPQGVAPLAAQIHKEGLLPGLWLAPFILHPRAEIIKEHPDWLLRKANSKKVNAGYVWGSLTTALDLTVPEALDYACRVVKTASQKWGYPYLKLDFLYAAAVDCQYRDRTLTRAQVLRRGMQAIREAVGPEVTLLGCGAPLGSMLGLVEAMRIGADVSANWTPRFAGIGAFFHDEPAMPCARNSMRNILTRASLHNHWWINDPDCLLIRPDTSLSLAEVQSLASAITLTGGSLLLSDDLPALPAERLRVAASLLPVIGQRARVVDWFDAGMPARLRLDLLNETGEWHVLAAFNWQDQAADLKLSAAEYHLPEGVFWVSEFWGAKVIRLEEEESVVFPAVLAHGCVVTAWRRQPTGQPVYLGGDLHISQGIEVAEWKITSQGVAATLRLPRKADGMIRVWVPGSAPSVSVNGTTSELHPDQEGVLSIPVDVDGFAKILIEFL